ncbi:MAG: ferritin-like domain-containing protein [bacterium]
MKRLQSNNILKLLEDDLEDEYKAIGMYQEHIEKIDIKEIRDVLLHIRKEEEEHVDELKMLIEKYKKC